MSVLIRKAVSQDAEILLDIYRPYVENTAISFEYKAPDIHEFRCRMDNLIEKYPYIAAEEQGQIVGYAYSSAFNERQAYARSVETTIYIYGRTAEVWGTEASFTLPLKKCFRSRTF